MPDYVEFHVSPREIQTARPSSWELRNQSTKRIMEEVRSILVEDGSLKREWTVRIHINDLPTPPGPSYPWTIEFQTISEFKDNSKLFPDSFFGGWWHMGMKSWDPFVKSLAKAGSKPPSDQRAFWKGAHLGVDQRKRYADLCSRCPERFAGGFMEWGPVLKGFVRMEEQCSHSVLVDLTGIGYSGRLKMLAFTGRPLLVAKRKWWCWADLEILKLGLHTYVAEDLSDLVQKYDALMENTPLANEKAKELMEHCMSHMTFRKVCERAAGLVRSKMRKKEMIF